MAEATAWVVGTSFVGGFAAVSGLFAWWQSAPRPDATDSQETVRSQRRQAAQLLWKGADAVCFDVDGTLTTEEGFDALADYEGCGGGKEIAELTKAVNDGHVTVDAAWSARLRLLAPSRAQIRNFLRRHPPRFTLGAEQLIFLLRQLGVEVFLVTHEFKQLIEPVITRLEFDEAHVIANSLTFNEHGDCTGMDTSSAVAHKNGKALALRQLKERYHFQRMVMVGDGIPDMCTRPSAAAVVGFTGVFRRASLEQSADWCVSSFAPLIASLLAAQVAAAVQTRELCRPVPPLLQVAGTPVVFQALRALPPLPALAPYLSQPRPRLVTKPPVILPSPTDSVSSRESLSSADDGSPPKGDQCWDAREECRAYEPRA